MHVMILIQKVNKEVYGKIKNFKFESGAAEKWGVAPVKKIMGGA